MCELNNFFDPLSSILKTTAETKKHYNKWLATDFNVLSLIGIQEVLSTYFFAILLDPNGSHGQGDKFLRLFLSELENTIKEQIHDQEKIILYLPEPQKTDTERLIRIKKEFSTTEGQIDLFIEWKEFVLAIENKFWAVDQKDQLIRYAKYLKDRKRFLLIYLCPTGRKPKEYSLKKEERSILEENGEFIVLNHNDFTLPWLDKCVMYCEAEKVKWFLKDFKERINEIIKGDSEMSAELDQVKNFILLTEKNIREERIKIAVECYSLIPKLYNEVLKKAVKELINELEMFFKNKGYKSSASSDFLEGKGSSSYGFYKEDWIIDKKPILSFSLEFLNNNYGNLLIGLKKGGENEKAFLNENNFTDSQGKEIKNIREKFKNIVGEPINDSEWYIVYSKKIQGWPDYNQSWENLYRKAIRTFTDEQASKEIFKYIIENFSKLSEQIENDIDELREIYRRILGN